MSSRHNIVACFENISLNYLRLSSFNHMTDICIKKNPVIATIIGPSKFDTINGVSAFLTSVIC